MKKKRIVIKKCLVCGYTWEARKRRPKCCPECKSRRWDKG